MVRSQSFQTDKNFSAFSLIEILIVIALISITATFFLPVGLDRLFKSDVRAGAQTVVSNIFLMQQNSYNFKDSGEFGLYFNNGNAYIYEGSNYAGAVWSDQLQFEDRVRITSVTTGNSSNEVHFSAGSLMPSTTASITIGLESAAYVITLNSEGLVDSHQQ